MVSEDEVEQCRCSIEYSVTKSDCPGAFVSLEGLKHKTLSIG